MTPFNPDESTPRSAHPLLVLGIDAGDPEFIEKWAAEGRLPNIARLMEQGLWGRTGGPELLSEHGTWISAFSGVSRADHGYFYFRQLIPGTYDLKTQTGLELDVPPFWSTLVGSGLRSAIIDAWELTPTPELEGFQLCNWGTHNNWGREHYATSSLPANVLERVAKEIAPKLVAREDEHATFDQDRDLYHLLLKQTKQKGNACRMLVSDERYDLIVAVMASSHAANHQLWKYQPGLANGTAGTELTNGIRDVYEAIDGEIGKILECLPGDTNVAIVSSVGMDDDYPTTGLIEDFCRKLGYQAYPTASTPSWRPLDVMRRFVPERMRVAISRNFSRALREQLLSDGFRSGSDWSRTRAFAIPAAYTSFLRVNLRGREPQGIVEPGREYNALLDEIEADLALLIDPADGKPAVTNSIRTECAFEGSIHDALPDLFVRWKSGSFMRRVEHPRCTLRQDPPDFFRRSDHCEEGWLAMAGPDIPPAGRLPDPVDVLSLAPTFLSLLGHPPSQGMKAPVLSILRRPAVTAS